MARQRAKKEIMHHIPLSYGAWSVVLAWSETSDNIVRVLQKIERHKEQFLVPVLVSIQCSQRRLSTTRLHVFFQENIGYLQQILIRS